MTFISRQSELETEDLIWADAFLVVYSVTDKNTFKNAIQMVEAINDNKAMDEKFIALVGNKKDLNHFREGELSFLISRNLVT